MPRKAKSTCHQPSAKSVRVKRMRAGLRSARSDEQWQASTTALAAAAVRETADRKRLSSLASQLSLAEERERRRIAVEIHDNLSQDLALIKMKVGMLQHKALLPEVRDGLEEVLALIDPVLERTRSLTFELSPPVLYELGLDEALEWLAERMAQQHHMVVRFEPAPRAARAAVPVPHDVAVLLFQAVRELLMNVVKHARARRATVRSARADGTASVTVSDDGRGFDPAKLTPSRHRPEDSRAGDARRNGDGDGAVPQRDLEGFGLFSIRTRLEHLGGRMEVRSAPGGGTDVTLTVPLAPASAEKADGNAPRNGFPPGSHATRCPEIALLRHVSPGPDGSRRRLMEPFADGTRPSSSPKRSKQ